MNQKQKYQVCNWSQYNQSLIARGSLSLWINDEVIKDWYSSSRKPTSGFQRVYSDTCIKCGLRLKAMYGLSLRAVQGFMESLVRIIDIDIKVPNYTTLCRRQQQLSSLLERPQAVEDGLVLAIDSTGLKVFGEGEWKTRIHGYNYHRVWRKLHIAIDIKTLQIEAVALSTNDFKDGELLDDLLDQIDEGLDKVIADGAYESFANFESVAARGAEPVIPPRKDAKIRQHGNSANPPLARDQVVRAINKTTRKKWKETVGYHLRSLVETTMYRFKTLFGSTLSARLFDSQFTEVIEKCCMLNQLTSLGMPDGKIV